MSNYSKQLDAENERRIKSILKDLPSFAKLYFDDAHRSKLSKTRLGYARDMTFIIPIRARLKYPKDA